jgi:hypothetical protein
METKARALRRLAEQITECLRHYRPSTWAFAASPEVNGAILDHVPSELQQMLTRNLKHDLVNTPADKLLQHVRGDNGKMK